MTANLDKSARFVNGGISHWYSEIGFPEPRSALPGDIAVDVAIVGGGFTGLWAAFYLKTAQPDLRIAVLEKEFAGFGASGRNGGWLSAEPPGQLDRYARSHGLDAAIRLQQTMFASVDEVIRVAHSERIDAHIQKDGLLRVATNAAQQARLVARLPELRRHGWDDWDAWLLSSAELRARVNLAGATGAVYSPHAARIQPAMLVRGLADAVERLGVAIYEATPVTAVRPGGAMTAQGVVRADYVIRALEGFTAGLEGFGRSLLPMSSSMIVTERLPDRVWEDVGWSGAELIGAEAHGFAYAQRTADRRIALGGRGVPYRFGSRWDHRGRTMDRTLSQLRSAMGRLFPATMAVGIDQAWTGVLGVARDWCASVGLDPRTGLGWAEGYVGHGVTSANLAGRTLADLLLRRATDLVTLPWVDRRVRRWEVEPLRWLGVRGVYVAYRAADRLEQRRGADKTSVVARVADRVSGR